jgi:hypothetical protein
VLVNNAGYAQIGVFEETSEADVQIQFETNVFGLMRVTRAVLPTMRAQRAGHIITSVRSPALSPLSCARSIQPSVKQPLLNRSGHQRRHRGEDDVQRDAGR